MGEKPNCYDCKHRGELDYSCHSACLHPLAKANPKHSRAQLNVVGSDHGIRNGWFTWPWDFDPVWLEHCDGFAPKGTP